MVREEQGLSTECERVGCFNQDHVIDRSSIPSLPVDCAFSL